MNEPDIRRLSDLASRGSQIALAELVEWGLDEVLPQYLEGGFLPLWARVRLKRQLEERNRLRDAVDRQHQTRTRKLEAAVELCYYDLQADLERGFPLGERSKELHRRLGYRLSRYKLKRRPSLRLVRRVVHRLAPERRSDKRP